MTPVLDDDGNDPDVDSYWGEAGWHPDMDLDRLLGVRAETLALLPPEAQTELLAQAGRCHVDNCSEPATHLVVKVSRGAGQYTHELRLRCTPHRRTSEGRGGGDRGVIRSMSLDEVRRRLG